MKQIPKHVAIIMDGNGRWAKAHGLSRIEGHRLGAEVTDEIVTAANDLGVSYLTLYAFSDENWNRPADEVAALMILLQNFLQSRRPKMVREGIRFSTIGDLARLPQRVREEIAETKEVTAHGSGLTLVLALSYGSKQEIVRSVNRLIEYGKSNITVEDISSQLDTDFMPDPDLLIRTSGEKRISNFLLWQLAYTELYFTDTLWPEFSTEEFKKALAEYQKRERRFGKTSEQILRKVGSGSV